jgi:heptaprenylglyceryl phosphate synthase
VLSLQDRGSGSAETVWDAWHDVLEEVPDRDDVPVVLVSEAEEVVVPETDTLLVEVLLHDPDIELEVEAVQEPESELVDV